MFKIDVFDAVLNPPQAAILAVGRMKERALVENGQLIAGADDERSACRSTTVCWTAHVAARFLGDLVELIETPGLALG